MKRILVSFGIIKNNVGYCIFMATINTILFSFMFVLINILGITNKNMLNHLYGNENCYIEYFNFEKKNIVDFGNIYVNAKANVNVSANGEEFNDVTFSFYNSSFCEMIGRKIEGNCIVIPNNISETYYINDGDFIEIIINGLSLNMKVVCYQSNNDVFDIFLPINVLNNNILFNIVRFNFNSSDIAIIKKIYSFKNDYYYNDPYSIIKTYSTLNVLKLILIISIFILNLLIGFSSNRLCQVLIKDRYKEIGIKRAYGYTKKDISIIYSAVVLVVLLLASMLSFVLSLPIYNYVINGFNRIMVVKLDYNVSGLWLILDLTLVVLLTFLMILVSVRKCFKTKIIMLIKG